MLIKFLLKCLGMDDDDPAVRQEYDVTENRRESGLVLPQLSRRALFKGIAATAAVAAAGKIFSFPAIRKWDQFTLTPIAFHVPFEYSKMAVALQLEKVNDQIPLLVERQSRLWEFYRGSNYLVWDQKRSLWHPPMSLDQKVTASRFRRGRHAQ